MSYKNLLAIALLCLSLQACAAGEKKVSANNTPTSAEDVDPLFAAAESLRISGDSAKALDKYNELLDKDKNNLSAIEGRALCYLQKGDADKALADLNYVVEKDSARWRALNAIGVAYSISGKDDEALKYYNMAQEVSGNNPSVLNNIALGVAFAGEYEKGINILNNALSAMPESAKKKTLENNLALIYGISGKMDEAEKILRKNLPEAAVYNNLGYYAKLSSDKTLAWSYLSKAISASPVYYAKAENNMAGLEKAVIAVSGGATLENESAANEAVTQVASVPGISKAEITELQMAEISGPKIAPVKAWRGTARLPLPTLRPNLSSE